MTPPGRSADGGAGAKPSIGRDLNADLHCHSNCSDGVLAPAVVVERAFANGVDLLSLTDHDDLGGLDEAARRASELGLRFVPGVEVSVSWAGETIHVLGLGIDPVDRALSEGLAKVRSGRIARAREIARRLESAGVAGAWEGALRHVGNPGLVSRTHFARHIVETGMCADVAEVFERFMVAGRPGHVPHRWARLDEAVGWIRGAGGRAAIAHPARYRLGETGLWALLSEFKAAGGEALEIVCASHTDEHVRGYARRALEFGFMGSRGSDFHAPGESRFEIGALPSLPSAVVPVWHDWQ